MTALVLGIDPEPLGVAPFVMSADALPPVLATELGLDLHPRARAVVLPALGAYVGGDIVAGMLATGMDRDKRTRLFIDVGTNCEIVLSDGDTIVSTAAPAGPAFEGGAIRCGMRAADGAVEVIRLDPGVDGGVHLGVIGDVEPQGLCGSGLVDAVSELVRAGLLDSSGRFVTDERAAEIAPHVADRLTAIGKERVFVLHRPEPDSPPEQTVYLSQRDVRELQFAKARDRDRLDAAARAARARARRRPAGAAGRLVRQLPLPRRRRPDRAGAEAPGAAHRLRGQRRRRGREDGLLSPARARRRRSRCWRRWSMSSSPTAPTSTTGSSTSSPSPADRVDRSTGRPDRPGRPGRLRGARPAVRRGGRPPRLAGRRRTPPAAAAQPPGTGSPARSSGWSTSCAPRYASVVVGYADCGTYGALDEVCERLGLPRLAGLHCYDVYAGADRVARIFEEQPGTYVLTDFLVRSFERTVIAELGLDRSPGAARRLLRATTPGWCGWPSSPTTSCGRSRSGPRPGSACR